MESVNFNHCSTDAIRESPLPFRIQHYPPDRVIETTGEAISKLSKKLFSILENNEYDLDSIVLKCEQRFSRKVLNGIEKLYKNKGLKNKNKTEIYPDYLRLQMPIGGAHRMVRQGLNSPIFNALEARFQDRYIPSGDIEVFIDQECRNYWQPDCSFVHATRPDQCLQNRVPQIPNLVVEIGSTQSDTDLASKIGSWFTIGNGLGHVVDITLAIDLTYVDRGGNGQIVTDRSRGRLSSVKFSLFPKAESIQRLSEDGRGVITTYMPELQTIQANIGDGQEVEFVHDPQSLSRVRSPDYFHDRENNLHIPFHMLDGVEHDRNLPDILLTEQNMINIVQDAYYWHELEIVNNNLRAQAREANRN